MGVRRDTKNRLILYRTCGICGATFSTTADTPFVRQMPNREGKKLKTVYFCSEKCKRASYKHLFDGHAEDRRAARYARRDIRAKNKRYYDTHAEEERARQRAAYWADPEAARADSAYHRYKRKLLTQGVSQ